MRTVKVSDLPQESDSFLPVIWSDYMEIVGRGDIPITLLRFYAIVKDRLIEEARIQTSIIQLQKMIDVMCKTLNYYPTKPK